MPFLSSNSVKVLISAREYHPAATPFFIARVTPVGTDATVPWHLLSDGSSFWQTGENNSVTKQPICFISYGPYRMRILVNLYQISWKEIKTACR